MKALNLNKEGKKRSSILFLVYFDSVDFEKDKISITQYPKIDFSNYKNIRKRLIPIRIRKRIENPINKYLKYFSLSGSP